MIEFMIDPEKYLPDPLPSVKLLATDLAEPELMVREIAALAESRSPCDFSGETPLIFYRLRYTPPYENFREIRNLILLTRKACGLRSCYRGILAVDVSEYRGHEEDEYFTVLLKYLYDTSTFQSLIFVCCRYTEKDMKKLCGVCMKYFSVTQEYLRLFERTVLKKIIENAFTESGVKAGEDAAELLADVLCREELSPWRSLQLIERLPLEITAERKKNQKRNRTLHAGEIRSFLQDPGSSLCMMAGHILFTKQKEDNNEKTI